MLDFVLILFRAVGRTFQAVDTHMSVSCFGIVVEFLMEIWMTIIWIVLNLVTDKICFSEPLLRNRAKETSSRMCPLQCFNWDPRHVSYLSSLVGSL